MQQGLEPLKTSLVEQLTALLEGKVSKEKFLELHNILHNTPEVQKDMALFESFTVIDFLAKQLDGKNDEYVSPQIIEEACTYMLAKLMNWQYP